MNRYVIYTVVPIALWAMSVSADARQPYATRQHSAGLTFEGITHGSVPNATRKYGRYAATSPFGEMFRKVRYLSKFKPRSKKYRIDSKFRPSPVPKPLPYGKRAQSKIGKRPFGNFIPRLTPAGQRIRNMHLARQLERQLRSSGPPTHVEGLRGFAVAGGLPSLGQNRAEKLPTSASEHSWLQRLAIAAGNRPTPALEFPTGRPRFVSPLWNKLAASL